MWRRSLLSLLLLLALSSPLFSAERPNPAAMTDSEIYAELSMISERQLKRWEMLETELPQLQLKSETLGKDLETLSLSLNQAEKTLSDRTSLLENSIEEIESEAQTLKIWNIVLLVLTGVAGGLAIWALAQ